MKVYSGLVDFTAAVGVSTVRLHGGINEILEDVGYRAVKVLSGLIAAAYLNKLGM